MGIQLKASENKSYIETTLKKYQIQKLIISKGVAEKINHPLVSDSSISLKELNNINDEGFEKLLDINHGEYLAKRRDASRYSCFIYKFNAIYLRKI